MDQARFSHIAHRNHAFCNPVNEPMLMQAAEHLSLAPGQRVVDFGAGKCELLIRMIEGFDVTGIAVDSSRAFLDDGRFLARGRIPEHALLLEHVKAEDYLLTNPDLRFDAAICIGATHAFGGYGPALERLTKCTHPGARFLVGEGYWRRKPEIDYLKALGAGEADLTSHSGNILGAEDAGLDTLWEAVSSEQDWDDYEYLYASTVEAFVERYPDDLDSDTMREKIRKWRDTYRNWGRDTLGFGLYVLAKRDV